MREPSPRVRELRDGTPVVVRAVRPSDRPTIETGFGRLSPRTRLDRFLAPVREPAVALERGIRRFVGVVRAGNRRAVEPLRRVAGALVLEEPGLLRFEVDLSRLLESRLR